LGRWGRGWKWREMDGSNGFEPPSLMG
jgi:hypothetical protein